MLFGVFSLVNLGLARGLTELETPPPLQTAPVMAELLADTIARVQDASTSGPLTGIDKHDKPQFVEAESQPTSPTSASLEHDAFYSQVDSPTR
jgi:hypothetical protein